VIIKQFNNPHVIYQEADDDQIYEEAISACVDNGNSIVLQQRGTQIVVSKKSVNELCRLLRKLRDAE
jgi:hypothetical protein